MEPIQSSSGFKHFTIAATSSSIFVVVFIFLHEAWYHPEGYPDYYALFFTGLYSFLFIMWTWAYIVTISCNKKTPKSALVTYK